MTADERTEKTMAIDKSDYEESCCFAEHGHGGPPHGTGETGLPVQRIIEKLDELLNKDRTKEADDHLTYWLGEAKQAGDWGTQVTILNEMMGLYRSIGLEEKGMESVRAGLELIKENNLDNTVTAATTWLNAATTMKAFGHAERTMPYYETAARIYGEKLAPEDYRFAGLYNNMALACVDLEEYPQAESYYMRAMKIMEKLPRGEMELAVTWVNLACLYESWKNDEEKASECLKKALVLLDAPDAVWDGYYAFTCKKCAPTFGKFGFFRVKKDLEERAAKIYEN